MNGVKTIFVNKYISPPAMPHDSTKMFKLKLSIKAFEILLMISYLLCKCYESNPICKIELEFIVVLY